MNKDRKKSVLKAALKGKIQNVAVINTPTVKVEHEDYKPKPMKPTLRLSSDDLASIKNWSVGKKYKLELEVEQTSMRQGNEFDFEVSDSEGKDKINASFKVISVKAV